MENVKFIVLLILIDSIWLVGNKRGHQKQFEAVQKSELKLDPVAGFLFYVVASIGYSTFIKNEQLTKKEAFIRGFILGFVMYATFDLTSKAVFRDYTWSYAILDILWGSVAVGMVCSILD